MVVPRPSNSLQRTSKGRQGKGRSSCQGRHIITITNICVVFFWCISYGVLCMLWQHFVYRFFFSQRSSDCCLAVPFYSWHYFLFIFLLSFIEVMLLCLLCKVVRCELCELWMCWLQSNSQSKRMEVGDPSCSLGDVNAISHCVVSHGSPLEYNITDLY